MKSTSGNNRIWKIIGICLIAIQLIVAVAFGVKVYTMGVCPTMYLILFGLGILALCVGTFFALRRRVPGIIMSIISVVVTGVLVFGLLSVIKLDNTIDSISEDTRLETVQLSVYVKANDQAESIADLSQAKIGYLSTDGGVDNMISTISEATEKEPAFTGYDNAVLLVEALLAGNERAMIVNSAYIEIMSDTEGYADLGDRIKEIDTISVEVEAEEPKESEEAAYDLSSVGNTMVIYLSGIDTWGAVNTRSRSDVNILAVVNVGTGHIQLINTPRDYYVYFPLQGAYDKLTHAGLYGVESSIAALEYLYGVKVDYYVRMNFSGFEAIIDTLGGVDVYSEYDFTVDPIKHYTVGYNHLTGLEALAFARERHAFTEGDVQRGRNQMEVIKAVIAKMTSVDALQNYDALLSSVQDCVMMNIPADVIYNLVKYQLSTGLEWKIDNYTVSGTGTSAYTYSMPNTTCYVMIPNETDVAEARRLMEAVLLEQ